MESSTEADCADNGEYGTQGVITAAGGRQLGLASSKECKGVLSEGKESKESEGDSDEQDSSLHTS